MLKKRLKRSKARDFSAPFSVLSRNICGEICCCFRIGTSKPRSQNKMLVLLRSSFQNFRRARSSFYTREPDSPTVITKSRLHVKATHRLPAKAIPGLIMTVSHKGLPAVPHFKTCTLGPKRISANTQSKTDNGDAKLFKFIVQTRLFLLRTCHFVAG